MQYISRKIQEINQPLFISFAIAYGVAFLGVLVTSMSVASWYAGLMKPWFSPPNWLFGPVWTVLYGVMAVAAWRVWEAHARHKLVREALIIYGVQLAFNLMWSIAFFGFQDPLLGLAVMVVLFVALTATGILFYRIDETAGVLFIPYFLWVCFAMYLNLVIVILN